MTWLWPECNMNMTRSRAFVLRLTWMVTESQFTRCPRTYSVMPLPTFVRSVWERVAYLQKLCDSLCNRHKVKNSWLFLSDCTMPGSRWRLMSQKRLRWRIMPWRWRRQDPYPRNAARSRCWFMPVMSLQHLHRTARTRKRKWGIVSLHRNSPRKEN